MAMSGNRNPNGLPMALMLFPIYSLPITALNGAFVGFIFCLALSWPLMRLGAAIYDRPGYKDWWRWDYEIESQAKAFRA